MVRKVSGTKKRKSAVSGTRKKAHHRRKRRISGTGDIMGAVTKLAGLTLGAVAGRQLNALAVKIVPSIANEPILSGALQIGTGYFLPKMMKGAFMSSVGDGMMGNGGMVIVVSMAGGALAGVVNPMPARKTYVVNGGVSNMKVIQGVSNMKVIGNAGAVNGFDTRISNVPTNLRVKMGHYV